MEDIHLRINEYIEQKNDYPLTEEVLSQYDTKRELINYLRSKRIRIDRVLDTISYEKEKALLQISSEYSNCILQFRIVS